MTDSQITEAIEALKAHGYLTIQVAAIKDWSIGTIDKGSPLGFHIQADLAALRMIADDLLSIYPQE